MKKEILKIADDAINGFSNPLEAYIILKGIIASCELSMKSIHESAIDEARKCGKSFSKYDAHIEVRDNAGRWKYDHIPEWILLKDNIKTFEERAKLALKQREKGMTTVDDITGEVVEAAEYIPGTENIFIKL